MSSAVSPRTDIVGSDRSRRRQLAGPNFAFRSCRTGRGSSPTSECQTVQVLSAFLDFMTAIGPALYLCRKNCLGIAFGHHKLTSSAIDKAPIFSATFGDTELFPFAVDCTRAMNLSADNLQSTALSLGRSDAVLRRYVDRLSWQARNAHLQLTANRIL
jgi:hypothetical protein